MGDVAVSTDDDLEPGDLAGVDVGTTGSASSIRASRPASKPAAAGFGVRSIGGDYEPARARPESARPLAPSARAAGDGDAVVAGEVLADLDVGEATRPSGAIATAAPWFEPISSTSQPPCRSRRGAPDDELVGCRRGRPPPANNASAGSQSVTDASTSTEPTSMYGGFDTITSKDTSAGNASNQEPWAMRTLRPARPRPARLARATSSALATGVGDPDRRAVEREFERHRQPDRPGSRPEIGDGARRAERPCHLDRRSGDEFGLGSGDQHPLVDRQLDVAEAPLAEHVLERFTGRQPSEHRIEVGDHPVGGFVAEDRS